MIELHLFIGTYLSSLICKKFNHIKGYFWIYGDEICPRCNQWLNKSKGQIGAKFGMS